MAPTERPRLRSSASRGLLLLLSLLIQNLGPCSSINDEGRALLRFRERVEVDPFSALSDWVAGGDAGDPCDWAGVECENGQVIALNLKDLCLKGTLAPELGQLVHLKFLVLHNNSFYGTIPKEFEALMNLEVLDLRYNNLNGAIPFDLGNTLSLDFLQFRSNTQSELYDLSMQSKLEVDGNTPSSNEQSITRNHANMTIRKLLQVKKMKGKGPKNRKRQAASPSPAPSPAFPLASPSPSPLPPQTSRHRPIFSSPAPSPSPVSAPSPSSSPTSRDPQSQEPSPSASHGHDHTPAPSPMHESLLLPGHTILTPTFSIPSPTPFGSPLVETPHAKRHMVMFGVVGMGALGFVALLTICIHCYRRKKVVTVKPWVTGLSGQLQKAFVTGVPQLKRSEIETACEDFSNIIGSLSDCILYKGTLSSGVEIAVASTLVASAKKWSKHSEAQFRNKVAILSKVNHKNFVNLLGYCMEEEPFTRMMVFEYAPNGTLFEHLHVKDAEDLNWAARLRIGMGIAYCLDHMHQLNTPVILRNLQSSSIYLTDDFAAKISDFEFSSETTVAVTASGDSDLPDKQIPNPESIVYEFGILLLEIVSGRLPYSEGNGEVSDWASNYLRGSNNLRDVIDPSLKTFRDEDVHAICEVIHRCCNSEPRERPTMKEVAGRLRDITDVPPDAAMPKLSPLWWAELEILSTEVN